LRGENNTSEFRFDKVKGTQLWVEHAVAITLSPQWKLRSYGRVGSTHYETTPPWFGLVGLGTGPQYQLGTSTVLGGLLGYTYDQEYRHGIRAGLFIEQDISQELAVNLGYGLSRFTAPRADDFTVQVQELHIALVDRLSPLPGIFEKAATGTSRPFYLQARGSYLGFGAELGRRLDTQRKVFVLAESEGASYLGRWSNFLAGVQYRLHRGLFIKSGLGWRQDYAIAGDLSGVLLSSILGWDFPLVARTHLGFEALGGSVVRRIEQKDFSFTMAMPKITLSYVVE
jgi:hypothetical protein